jgi:hypothetical protein
MKRLLLLPILCLLLLVCLKPEHDNDYDPDNPNKANLEGNVYGFDTSSIMDAKVALFDADSNSVEQYSDNGGWYGFDNVDPGIYKIVAERDFYGPFEFYPESLPAGAEDTFDIYFYTAFWHFEDEPLNTQEPKGFRALVGTWAIIDDPDQGYVYNGITPGTGLAIAVTDVSVEDFYYESMFKVDTSSGNTFFTGIVFRYQDDQNYYLVFCSSDSISFIEASSGGWTTIDKRAHAFTVDRWYLLSVDCCDNHMKVFVDNQATPVFDITNNTFSRGRVGLFAEYHTTVSFDDIYIELSK